MCLLQLAQTLFQVANLLLDFFVFQRIAEPIFLSGNFSVSNTSHCRADLAAAANCFYTIVLDNNFLTLCQLEPFPCDVRSSLA